jgi:hypothetical protein
MTSPGRSWPTPACAQPQRPNGSFFRFRRTQTPLSSATAATSRWSRLRSSTLPARRIHWQLTTSRFQSAQTACCWAQAMATQRVTSATRARPDPPSMDLHWQSYRRRRTATSLLVPQRMVYREARWLFRRFRSLETAARRIGASTGGCSACSSRSVNARSKRFILSLMPTCERVSV